MKDLICLILISMIAFVNLHGQCIQECGLRTVYGFDAGNIVGDAAAFFGYFAGRVNSGDNNSFFGHDSGRNNTSGNNNSFFGRSAGISNTSGISNSFFGRSAGWSNSGGDLNCFFGVEAGNSNTTANNNNFFGFQAGYSNESTSNNNFFGYQAGYSNSSGFINNFFGSQAGYSNVSGMSNNFFGHNAGMANSSGSRNSFFGSSAGVNNTIGTGNCFFGQLSGHENVEGSGNSFFGTRSGGNNLTGIKNSFFGYWAGTEVKGDSNIVIGANAGPDKDNGNISNRLFIDVKESNEPLIYGEFDHDFIRVNGTFEAMAVGNNSDVHRKEAIEEVNTDVILEKIVSLNISEWSYKDDPVRHIGPMAQDFHYAFGVGKNSTTITTIDADGVALAGIQALKKENEELRSIIDTLFERIEKLENR